MEYDGVLMLSAGSGYGPFDTVNLELRRHRKVKCLPARPKAELINPLQIHTPGKSVRVAPYAAPALAASERYPA